MPTLDVGHIGTGGQPLGHELADGLQHPRPATGQLAVDLDQAVPRQPLDQVEGAVLVQTSHHHDGFDGPSVDEHRQRLEQRSLGLLEQTDTPIHRGPQRALALGRSTDPDPAASSDVANQRSNDTGSSNRIRAAASSMANGTPSSRLQISTTAAALSAVSSKS